MKIKSIILNTEAVRAILNGQKTCIRKTIKPPSKKPTLTGMVGMQTRGCGWLNLSGVRNLIQIKNQRGEIYGFKKTRRKF